MVSGRGGAAASRVRSGGGEIIKFHTRQSVVRHYIISSIAVFPRNIVCVVCVEVGGWPVRGRGGWGIL